MSEPTSYPSGALCWADLITPDPIGAERFYTAVFGWDYVRTGPAFDHYRYATSSRQMVAGIGRSANQQSSWLVSFAVVQVDALVGRVEDAGGQVEDGPSDFGIQGRSLFVRDAVGAYVGFWQPRAHLGAGLFGDHTALCWAELAAPAPDFAVADSFYHAVLGLGVAEHPPAGNSAYAAYVLPPPQSVHGVDGLSGSARTAVAGRTALAVDKREAEPFWMPYFGVRAAAETAEMADWHGGQVVASTSDATGRGLAVLSDPWGATFAVLELPYVNGESVDE